MGLCWDLYTAVFVEIGMEVFAEMAYGGDGERREEARDFNWSSFLLSGRRFFITNI